MLTKALLTSSLISSSSSTILTSHIFPSSFAFKSAKISTAVPNNYSITPKFRKQLTENTNTIRRKMSSVVPYYRFSSQFLFRQLFDRTSCTYTYLLADTQSKEALLIDPVIELSDRDLKVVQELGLKLKYCLNTHVHADHVTGSGLLKKLTSDVKSVISSYSGAKADTFVNDGDILKLGQHEIEVRATPGHTNGCVTYVIHKESCAFTGDALLIRGCGRTDFQQGDSEKLYESVWNKILSLPEYFTLFPAHDYNGRTATSVGEEKQYNPRLTKSKDEFKEIMNNLGLAYPKMIDVALPANLQCGLYDLPENMKKLFE